jgi:negative regulator of flagellin synthesis FlgM
MKINQSPTPARPASGSATAGTGRASAASKPATQSTTQAPSGTGSTDAAARLSALESQFSQADFNAAKVSEISSQIAAGRYKVDAGAIADKLVASAASLARARN